MNEVADNSVVIEEIQSLSSNALIHLYELTIPLTAKGNPGQVYRFINENNSTEASVPFRGNNYVPFPVTMTNPEQESGQKFPVGKFTASNIGNIVRSIAHRNDDLIGAELKRILTFERFLTAQAADQEIYIEEIYQISRKLQEDDEVIVFEVTSPLGLGSNRLPRKKVIRSCSYIYRIWDATVSAFRYAENNPCPYRGASYFNVEDQSVTSPADDRCNKHIGGCRSRFGENSVLPMDGYPLIGRARRNV